MRVAVVTMETIHTEDTARTRRLDRIARQLRDDDHEVIVCCAQWWDGEIAYFEQDGIRYERVTTERSSRPFATRLPLTLRRVGADIIYASYWPISAAVSAVSGRWLSRSPVALDWYGDMSVDPNARLTRSALRLPDIVIAPSRHVRTKLRELGAAAENIEIVPDSIDVGRIKTVSPLEGVDIVTARRLDEAANVDMMLLGLAELRDRDWNAVVIGDGPAKARYERKAAELRIDDRVTFPGALTRDERIAHYRGAHVFVQTAEHCPFAVELLWAMASGCVGIVDYQEDSAAHELVEHLDRGFRTTDAEALSEAIVAAGDLDEQTFDDTFSEYDHEHVLAQYLRLFEELRTR